MFFQIENTPEHIRRARRKEILKKDSPKEECPRLNLAPFSRPPQVLFENVLIGTSCKRELEVFNPSYQVQQITLGKELPPGLVIHLPEEWLVVEPQTFYCLTMSWTPMQPTALRETIRFTDKNRGRYDVIVVLKSAMIVKGKGGKPKGLKISPGKSKTKPLKKSPVGIYKKKMETIYNSKHIKKAVNTVQSTNYKRFESSSNKENISTFNDFSMEFNNQDNPFETSSRIASVDFSEVLPNKKKSDHGNILENTYDATNIQHDILTKPEPQNILRPSKQQIYDNSASDLFDNLTFTPLKNLKTKCDKLEKGPKIVLSLNSDSDLDDSLNTKISRTGNEAHSIICVTTSHPPSQWLPVPREIHPLLDNRLESLPVQNKKIPNTSSPKELSSPNFSINTDFSRISELSFAPSRFSTEKKVLPRANNETREIFDDPNAKLNSDTYTKESPINSLDYVYQICAESRTPNIYKMENPKDCRQALFRDYPHQKEIYDKKYYMSPYELNDYQHGFMSDIKSPPRSLTPPLQSIPEESTQFSDTQVLDKTNKQTTTFTINRTFDKVSEKSFMSTVSRQSWSKKAIRAEPELWKIPALPRKSLKPKPSINSRDSLCGNIASAFDNRKSADQNVSLNQVGNVYSQSLTVDPFLSASYFYDEEAVHKVEKEFKRWLNCILTPPADLDSNVEQKIDVGKAWIENRNKEVPAAPTREQVCNAYHNSHRLDSLRRSARALLNSAEICQVSQKLDSQIEKKLLVIRTDKNLHLDVGLQKIIMELILSYNPLWLRIGLEALYGLVLPLKSNSDIEGLTNFIIQRMFKNPYLKNKHSKKSSAPNMLLPAYMEALKKFTLKKFFKLVFFLDLAKQRRLISHDPCLFCRNAICKESREIVIRFTRELIAGIGDITKHLRPLGYVVSHKQSYLDEYKYAVHNIALDIRDGVRLTKVMEIILMKNGLLNQLRTPPISRLQKIHNVQVAMNALKEANFVIDGDIAANDIADGHREKTLSLLWQLIHVFRAPLFEKAANVIQMWWRKKYEVIVEKRRAEEKNLQKLNKAASVVQCWWRRIQYNRLVECQTKQITNATITIQKYCRMWLCRTRLRKLKTSILIIGNWYKSAKKIREAKETLHKLKSEREELKRKSATLIQSHVRRWLCVKQFKAKVQKIILIQSTIRRFLSRNYYKKLIKSVTFIQKTYRRKLIMKEEMQKFAKIKRSAESIQSYYRMVKQRRFFQKLKESVKAIEERYIALVAMRKEREKYDNLKRGVVLIQARYRGNKCHTDYKRKRNMIVKLQRKFRAHLLMKKERSQFIQLKKAVLLIQNRFKSHLAMKKARQIYLTQHKSAILIQRYFRSYLITRAQRDYYIKLRNVAFSLQKRYKSLLAMRQERSNFLKLKNAAILIQRRYRALVLMKLNQESYKKLRAATIAIQQQYRSLKQMREERSKYLTLKSSCVTIQNAYRAYVLRKQQRQTLLKRREAAVGIQRWFRGCKKTKIFKQQYQQSKQACVTIQRVYRAYTIGRIQRKEYIRIRTATVCIQKYYRSYIEMKTVREQYIKLKTATVTIQRLYKSYLTTKKQRSDYLQAKTAAQLIQNYYRRYKEAKMVRHYYCKLRKTTISIQRKYRSITALRHERKQFLTLKKSVVTVQHKYRALVAMRAQKQAFLRLRSAAVTIQTRFRAHKLMKTERTKYLKTSKACVVIQRYYRAYVKGKKQREEYLRLKGSAIIIQNKYRAVIAMRKEKSWYLKIRAATLTIQMQLRARALMLEGRSKYQEILRASVTIQRTFRAYLAGKKQRMEYNDIKSAAIKIQTWYRNIIETRNIQRQYLQRELLKKHREASALCIQKNFRRYLAQSRYHNYRKHAMLIQMLWRGKLLTRLTRCEFLQKRRLVVKLQAIMRGYLIRKQVQYKKEEMIKKSEKARQDWAAMKIQALFLGHMARLATSHDPRIAETRRRWREGALHSTQQTLKERNEEAMEELKSGPDIMKLIKAFRSLELLTGVFPQNYTDNASFIASRVYTFMSNSNRSICSVEIFKYAAAVLVNLTRYQVTGPKIYKRERIPIILTFMLRFSNNEFYYSARNNKYNLFCILSTYLWLFSKYDGLKEDLTEFLHIPENLKMMTTIKINTERLKRIASKLKTKTDCVSHTGNQSFRDTSYVSGKKCSNNLPLGIQLQSTYGITRADKPLHFENVHHAISTLFHTYNL